MDGADQTLVAASTDPIFATPLAAPKKAPSDPSPSKDLLH